MFRRIVLTLAFCLSFALSLQAEERRIVETIMSTDGTTAIRVPTTTTIYTKSISLINVGWQPVGIMYKADNANVVNLKVEFEQSYQRPATEGAYDSEYITTDTLTASLAHKLWQLATIDGVEMPFGRFKITGQSLNSKDATIQFKVGKQ